MSDKAKKLLILVGRLGVGGGEQVVLNTISGLSPTEWSITLVPILGGGVWEDRVPKYVAFEPLIRVLTAENAQPLFRTIIRLIAALPKLFKLVSRHDLILASGEFGGPIYLGGFVARLSGKPLIGWAHGEVFKMLSLNRSLRSSVHKLLMPIAYSCAHQVLAVSEGVSKDITQAIPRLKGRVKVVYNPVILEEVRALAQRGLPESLPQTLFEHPIVIGSGRTEYLKGFDLLIKAHAQLMAKGIVQHLAIIGPAANADDSLRELSKKLGVSKTVFFLGYQANPFPLLKSSQVFAFPSRAEGFGLALVEAMALGLPTVTTDCSSGPVEILGEGKYGLIAHCEDINDLAGALERLLLSEEEREGFAKLALERAEFFSLKAYLGRFTQVLKDCLNLDEEGI